MPSRRPLSGALTSLPVLVLLAVALGLPALLVSCGPEDPSRAEAPAVVWRAGPPLPQPITNNAVAAVERPDGVSVFTFLGLDSTKVWSGVTNVAYRWDVESSEGWRSIPPVPGPGRLASTAQVVDGRIYVFGGYTVGEDGTERSVPDVDVYDPATDSWSEGADMALPVDDASSGVWRDSLVVVVSGWHDDGNVGAVQLYDPATDRWMEAGEISGRPVFGHGGTVVGDEIIYLDGVQARDTAPRFAMDTASWRGVLSPGSEGEPPTLEWRPAPAHPQPVLYRPASGTLGGLAVFVGGSTTPYNYDGTGYDGTPAEPLRQVLAWVPHSRSWRPVFAPPIATMDHRTLGVADNTAFLVGGMEAGRMVSNKVWYADVPTLLGYQP